ncbi:helix-turn-helix transcriptional regulator [Prauserella shujinwangii]|uniref:helix-turn-helix transcriptional regulator n=1 Tax=Prauserella shujinwangii TaxID=1453103 RepID=UPI0015E5D333|nr:AAA family ATPase [Prauserella shujinwangii]
MEFPRHVSNLDGREEIISGLRNDLEATGEGKPAGVLLEAPGGMGKSSVLRAMCEYADELGFAVLHGRASEVDRVIPWTTLRGVLRSNPAMVPGNPLLVPPDQADRYTLIDEIERRIRLAAGQRPVVVVLDDAHWADEMTALALRVLVPALARSPVSWLLSRRVTQRHTPAQRALDWLAGEHLRRVRLAPLRDDAVRRICVTRLRATPDASVLGRLAGCAGHPQLVEQLLASLLRGGYIGVDNGVATMRDEKLPDDFVAVVHEWLDELSTRARQVLDAVSVLGRPFTLSEAAELVGGTGPELVPAVNEAVHAGVLVDLGTSLDFRHDLLREAVYARLSAPVRSALHQGAAAVLRRSGRPIVEAAEHLLRSGGPAGDAAHGPIRRAIREAASHSLDAAADLLVRVVEQVEPHALSDEGMAAEVVRLLASAGRLSWARRLGEDALRKGMDPEDEAGLLLGLAEARKHEGRNSTAVEYTRRALSLPGLRESTRARLLSVQAHGLLYSTETEQAENAAAEAVRLAESAGDHASWVFGTVVRSAVEQSRGELGSAVDRAREAVKLSDRIGGEPAQRHPRLWLASALRAVDRFAEADAVCEVGQKEAAQLGTAWSQPLWHYYRAELRMAAGRLEDAAAEATAGVAVAERLSAMALTVPCLALLGRISVHRGQLDDASRHLHRASQLMAEGVIVGPEGLSWEWAVLHLARGERTEALNRLHGIYRGLPDRVAILITEPLAGATLVRIACETGRPELARKVLAACRKLAERNPAVDSVCGAAAYAAGVLHDDRALLQEALEAFQRTPRRLSQAILMEEVALAERAHGSRGRAKALLHDAGRLYASCGATRDAARTRRALREADSRSSGTGGYASTGLGCLTSSELRVVRLVARGLTNREVAARLYLSPHTVDSHLRHSFTKLGVTSRVELTRKFLSMPEGQQYHEKT